MDLLAVGWVGCGWPRWGEFHKKILSLFETIGWVIMSFPERVTAVEPDVGREEIG